MDKTIRRVAAIYDIHGNLPELDGVLADLEQAQPDVVIIGGDTGSGPMPRPTLERLLSLGVRIRWIRGNGDRDVVAAFDGRPLPAAMSESGRRATEWAARRLTHPQRDFLDWLPGSLTLLVIEFF